VWIESEPKGKLNYIGCDIFSGKFLAVKDAEKNEVRQLGAKRFFTPKRNLYFHPRKVYIRLVWDNFQSSKYFGQVCLFFLLLVFFRLYLLNYISTRLITGCIPGTWHGAISITRPWWQH
jgi:hypothetical protein